MPTIPRRQTPDPRLPKVKAWGNQPNDARYQSSGWRRARLAYIKQHPTCVECDALANVVDHIVPVRLGGEFWESSNWQAMCTSCHNAKSAKEKNLAGVGGRKNFFG